MLIEYVGHACFYVTNKEGTRIIIDPYDNSIGLAPVKKEADIAVITHHHFDHDFLDGVSGDYTVIDTPGKHSVKGVEIDGYELPHDETNGSERGMVVAFKIKTDGITMLHMGDVGIVPQDAFFDWAGKIDVLMIPIGGTFTVDAEPALEIMDRIGANIIIPIHYKTTKLTMDIESPHRFTELAKNSYDVAHLGSSKFELTPESLKKNARVIFMENSF